LIISEVKDNVRKLMADFLIFFLNCSSQRCNELFWQCYRQASTAVADKPARRGV